MNLFEQVGFLFSSYNIPAAFWVNIQLTFWAAIGALVLGTALGVMRVSPVPSLRWLGTSYVTIFRNTPLTVIMLFGVLGVWSQLKITFSQDFTVNFFIYAVVGLGLYHAAFVCEAVRSGINTVPLGQAEAARAIGLPFIPAARLVLLPQAFRGAVAPLGNVLIALIKNSTVAAAASVATETSSVMRAMIDQNGNLVVLIFMIFAVGYVILVVPVGVLTTSLSRKLAVSR
ncbi:amino acid ABC transporter permease [Serinibacter arcticus]|uniref:ABC-type amino acid transport system, permease component n=1 Tax=Serinibacter arcticus TaxID=1655435 RepID=A0A4Z1E634_9MICO|nr:ABC transporter permease subunit [Serinibacter arcticus]TGO05893.1 ABC-type amino acid transport system, permease component [Serinibacter arcticus]